MEVLIPVYFAKKNETQLKSKSTPSSLEELPWHSQSSLLARSSFTVGPEVAKNFSSGLAIKTNVFSSFLCQGSTTVTSFLENNGTVLQCRHLLSLCEGNVCPYCTWESGLNA